MNHKESSAVLEARLEKLETRLLRIEQRLHLDAPAQTGNILPAAPPLSPPPVAGPSSFAPPVAPPAPKPESKTPPRPIELPSSSAPSSASVAPPSAPVAPPSAPVSPPSAPVSPPSAPVSPPSASVSPREQEQSGQSLLDWEQLVGGKWALWAGLLSIFGAIASFLAYTWRYFSPEAKVTLGLVAGVAFLVAGEWTRKRAQSWFSEGVSGAGLAICFLSLWAGGAHFSIFGFGLTFGGMAVVSALGVWLAVRYDALSLNLLSVIGGFATPILLRGDSGGVGETMVLLLSYIAVLNAGVLGVSLFKRWRASTWLSFGATVFLLAFWMPDAQVTLMRPTVFGFFSLYFLLYTGTACFYSLVRREETAPEDIGLIIAATTLYAPFVHDLLRPIADGFPGAFMLGFAFFWAALCFLTTRLAPANRMLRDVTGALGLLAFTVAIPIQIAQPWLGIALMGEAAVLTWLARRGDSELLRRAGQIVWFLALLPLVAGLMGSAAEITFGLHAGGWPMLFGVAVTAWLAWSAHRRAENADELRDYYATAAFVGGAWLVARETWARGWALEGALMALAIYAVAVLVIGSRARFAAVRICALVGAVFVAATSAMFDSAQPAPAVWPLGNARFVALIGTAAALYTLTWLVRREPDELSRRAGQIVWSLASLPLLTGMLFSAGNAELGLHRGGWPAIFAIAFAAALAWSAHRRTDESDELRDVYARVAVAGGAWLVAREATAWTNEINVALISLAVYAVAVFATGAVTQFAAVRIGANLLSASVAATAVWLAWSHPAPELLPFWNARFAAMSAATSALGAVYQLARAIEFPLHNSEKETFGAFPIFLACLALAALSTELYFGFAHFAPAQWANRAFFALAMTWLLAALTALSVGVQTRSGAWRVWGYVVGGAALASLPVNALANATVWLPFANWRFAAFVVAVAVASVAAWLLAKARKSGVITAPETDAIGAFASAALVLALFSLTQETWEVGRYLAPGDWQRGAQMAISLIWSLFGALLLAGGVQFHVQGARLGALTLLAFTVCKVFLFDLSFLDGAGRALSLGGLGLALVFISWLYGRFGRASATN